MFQHPFTAIVSGPTGCGKTVFTLKLVEHAQKLIAPPPERTVWCYGIRQKEFNEYTSLIEFHEGLPSLDDFDGETRVLLIIDDLMSETNSNVTNIFTKGSHHKNISVIYITQNLFFSSKHNRTINLNTHYLVMFKNPRDVTQVSYLARQMNSKHIVEAFQDATTTPFGYLLIDLKPNTEDKYRVKTGIFPGDQLYAYVPK